MVYGYCSIIPINCWRSLNIFVWGISPLTFLRHGSVYIYKLLRINKLKIKLSRFQRVALCAIDRPSSLK